MTFEGIFGGYESSETSNRDESFSIDCHSDVVKVQCCPNIKVTSTLQPGLSGDYEKVGDYNGHTLYQVHSTQITSFTSTNVKLRILLRFDPNLKFN